MCVRATMSDGRARARRRRVSSAVADLRVVVAVDVLHEPAVGLVALADVLREGEVGLAVDGDLVVVVEEDEVVEAEVAGEARRPRRRCPPSCRRRSRCRRRAPWRRAPSPLKRAASILMLAAMPTALEMPCPSGPVVDLDAGREVHLGVSRRLRSPLAEVLELVERQVVAREVQHRVEQHRRVAAREHEAIAVGPVRVGRVVAEVARPDLEGDAGERHRRARVAGVGLLDAVDGEHRDRLRPP